MLMPLNVLGIKPKGVLHIGASTGEELPIYIEANVSTVVWFECNPDTIPYLRWNVEATPGHYVIEATISDKDGETIQFNVTNNGASSSILELGKHSEYYPDIVVEKKLTLKTRTVDSLLEENSLDYSQFDFANLDLQGAELKALRGMTKSLAYLQWVYTEVNAEELYKGCALVGDIDEFLKGYGFIRVRTAMTNMGWGDSLFIKENI